MEAVMPIILSFPPPAADLPPAAFEEGLLAQLRSLREADKEPFLTQVELGSLFDSLDPAVNTVPFAHALYTILQNPATAAGITCEGYLWNHMITFLHQFDPLQARYLGVEFTAIVIELVKVARPSHKINIILAPIRDALLRLDSSGSTFTWLDLLVARLALESRQYAAALPIIDRPKLYFPGMQTKAPQEPLCTPALPSHRWMTLDAGFGPKLKSVDVLEYFVFVGTIYIGLCRWESAADALELAVAYPSKNHGVSKVMVEAYKKWVIVGLLRHGKAPSLPSTTDTHAAKAYRALAKPYDAMAALFSSANATRLRDEFVAGEAIWSGDCNLGLMEQALAAYQQFQIRNLAQVYSTISIPEVRAMTESAESGSHLTSDEETESLVLTMINEGNLNATVSRPAGSVSLLTFHFDLLHMSETEVQKSLVQHVHRATQLTSEIRQTDRRLMLTREYLKWFQGQKKGKGGADDPFLGGPLDALDEEDLMGELV